METLVLPKGQLVYRSFKDDSRRKGFWYCINEKDTSGYGSKTAEFRLSRDLVLVDITSNSFYDNLKKLLIDETSKDINLKKEHTMILFPLGFDDIVFYRNAAQSIGVNVNTYPLKPHIHTESLLYFNGRSRLSVHDCDVSLAKFLNNTIGNRYDGIASLKQFPDIIRNGTQHPEVCIFDETNVEYVRDIPQYIIGGGKSSRDVYSEEDALPPLQIDSRLIERLKNNNDLNEDSLPPLCLSTEYLREGSKRIDEWIERSKNIKTELSKSESRKKTRKKHRL
jgi:hypothetical protein